MATVATETWTGTNGAAWPAQWTTTSTATVQIQGNAGRIAPAATAWTVAKGVLTGMAAVVDTEVLVTFTLGTTGEQYLGVAVQASTADAGDPSFPDTGYMLSLGQATGVLELVRMSGGVKTILGTGSTTLTAGTAYKLRYRVAAGVLQVRVWAASVAESATWTMQVTDPTPLTTAGRLRLSMLNGPAATSRIVTFDDLTVTAPPALVSDDFNRADGALGTAPTGQAWEPTAFGITSNAAKATGDGVALIETGTPHMDVSATITATAAFAIGITVNAGSPGDRLAFYRDGDGVPKLGLWSTQGFGVVVLRATAAVIPLGTYTFRMVSAGDTITCFIDGTEIYRYGLTFAESSKYKAFTKAGIRAFGAGTGTIDNFTVLAAASTSPDITPPTVPGGVTATANSSTSVTVAWTASSDKVGVASYRVLRDGVAVATAVTGTSYTDTVSAGTTYSYTVSAVDAAGNRSSESSAATVTVLPLTETWTGADGAAWPSRWTVTAGGTGSSATIQSNAGRLTYPSVSGYVEGSDVYLSGMPAVRDFDLTVTVTFSVIQEEYLYLLGRSQQGFSAAYGVNIYPHNGTATIGLIKWDEVNGPVGLTGDLAAGTWSAGVARKVRVQMIGDTLRCKVWNASGSEPGAWLGTVTDTTYSGRTGRVRMSYTTGNTTSGGNVTLDDLTVYDYAAPEVIGLSATAAASASAASQKTDIKALAATAAAAASVTASKTAIKGLAATASATAAATSFPILPLTMTASAWVVMVPLTPFNPAPAPVPDPVLAARPARKMTVTVYDETYTRLGMVPSYVSCSVTWQHLGVGTGELVVGEDDPIAPYLLDVDVDMIAVVVDLGDIRWSGRVATVTLQRDGPLGSGVLNAALVDDWVWAQRMLASQNGSNAALTSMPQFDTRTGPVASVAADYINAAATRLAVPVKASKPSPDTSPTVTLSARMTTLADLLTEPLKTAGAVMTVAMWLPGDPQPPNIAPALTTPTVLFAPTMLAAKPWLQWTDSMTNIGTMTFQGSQPLAYRAIVGLNGQDAARVYDQYTDTVRKTAVGTFGLPETYVDASDAALGTPSQNAAKGALAGLGGKASATFEVADASPWVFGVDYVVGDIATIKVGDSVWRQRVTKVTVTDDRDSGLVFAPVIGDDAPDLSGDDMMVRALARVAEGLRSLQAGR